MDVERILSRIDKEKLEAFTLQDGDDIQQASRGLEEAEVLQLWGISALVELGAEDRKFFNIHYGIGRNLAKVHAVDDLFRHMGQRNGHQACLSYLIRFSDAWPSVGKEESKTGDGFKFKVMME